MTSPLEYIYDFLYNYFYIAFENAGLDKLSVNMGDTSVYVLNYLILLGTLILGSLILVVIVKMFVWLFKRISNGGK